MAVVTSFVNACNRHDSESVSSCLHPDFDSIQPMYPSRNFRGADQVRRNWQAIFDAEPGFRLTVLRSAAAGDTVWLELHGAGRDAEVAGVFVMGVENERIRWARIYSALVDDAPAATSDDASMASAQLRPVPPLPEDTGWSEGATIAPAPPVDEDLIAPVVDIDGEGRARRGRGRRKGEVGPVPAIAAGDDRPAQEPVVEEAVVQEAIADQPVDDLSPTGTPPPDPAEAPPAQADSIDPESLVDPEHLTAADHTVEPERVADPDLPPETRSEYDFKELDDAGEPTMAVEAVGAEPGTAADPDLMVETMVEVEPSTVVDQEMPAEPEPQFFVEPGFVEPDVVSTDVVTPAPPATEPAPEPVPQPEAEPSLVVTTPPPPKVKKRKLPRRG